MQNHKVLEIVYQVLDELNEQGVTLETAVKSPNSVLFGDEGCLDSLGLVHLVALVEQEVEEAFGQTITLADERALSMKESPFRTVTALNDYIVSLLAA